MFFFIPHFYLFIYYYFFTQVDKLGGTEPLSSETEGCLSYDYLETRRFINAFIIIIIIIKPQLTSWDWMSENERNEKNATVDIASGRTRLDSPEWQTNEVTNNKRQKHLLYTFAQNIKKTCHHHYELHSSFKGLVAEMRVQFLTWAILKIKTNLVETWIRERDMNRMILSKWKK